jgi:hypothetical protein
MTILRSANRCECGTLRQSHIEIEIGQNTRWDDVDLNQWVTGVTQAFGQAVCGFDVLRVQVCSTFPVCRDMYFVLYSISGLRLALMVK